MPWVKYGHCGGRIESRRTGLFFSVGREPPDEGEFEGADSQQERSLLRRSLITNGRSSSTLASLKTLPIYFGSSVIHFDLCGENEDGR